MDRILDGCVFDRGNRGDVKHACSNGRALQQCRVSCSPDSRLRTSVLACSGFREFCPPGMALRCGWADEHSILAGIRSLTGRFHGTRRLEQTRYDHVRQHVAQPGKF
jgi:hypothetical protein